MMLNLMNYIINEYVHINMYIYYICIYNHYTIIIVVVSILKHLYIAACVCENNIGVAIAEAEL